MKSKKFLVSISIVSVLLLAVPLIILALSSSGPAALNAEAAPRGESAGAQQEQFRQDAEPKIQEQITKKEVEEEALRPPAHAGAMATLVNVTGDIMIHRLDGAPDTWEAATEGISVNNGDSIKTSDGSGRLRYGDEAEFTLNGNTHITLHDEPESQDVLLHVGNLNVHVNSEKATKPFQVATATAVCAVRGTEFTLNYNGEQELVVELDTGEMFIYSPEEINSGQQFEMDLTGGHTIGVRLDTQNLQLLVENSSESIGAVDFAVINDPDDPMDDNYYTAFPGETVMVNWEQTGYDELEILEEFNQKELAGLPNGISPTNDLNGSEPQ